MERLTFDLSKRGGSFKPMNAVNGGPWHRRYTNDQWRSNFEEYKAARIPFCAVPYTVGPMLMILRPFSRILTRILMILHPMILIVRMKRS